MGMVPLVVLSRLLGSGHGSCAVNCGSGEQIAESLSEQGSPPRQIVRNECWTSRGFHSASLFGAVRAESDRPFN